MSSYRKSVSICLFAFIVNLSNACANECKLTLSNASKRTNVLSAIIQGVNAPVVCSTDRFYKKDSTLSYIQKKAEIESVRVNLASGKLNRDSAEYYFFHELVYGLFPYWYGTAWAFEGYTATPGKGEIACGYFVSTTLLHLGLNLNRYKLAQQLPEHEAISLAVGDSVYFIDDSGSMSIFSKIDSLTQSGIYFLGFDQSHVGFLIKENDEIFVIHSNYIQSEGVVVEQIEESEAFASYYRFFLVPLSTNDRLIEMWLNKSTITVFEG